MHIKNAKIDNDSVGLLRRLSIIPGRINGKAAACLAEAVKQMKENYPDSKELLTCAIIEKELKKC